MRVAVVGFGAFGGGAAWALARRGHDVVAIDRHGVANRIGSSAGATRIFRLAYPEADYVRLCQRALAGWRVLEAASGEQLYLRRGLLQRGDRALLYADGLRAAGVPYELLDGADVGAFFPELVPRPGEPALWTAEAGPVRAGAAQEALARLVVAAGGSVLVDRVVAVADDGGGVALDLASGGRIEADAAVVAAGPWAGELLGPLGIELPLRPEVGQVAYVGAPDGPLLGRPCLIDHATDGRHGVYALPTPGHGYKIGWDTGREDDFDPAVAAPWAQSPDDLAAIAGWAAAVLPGCGAPHGGERCPWTLTPDGDFVIDRHGRVVVMAGCSGHGYKLLPAVGELAAELAEGNDAWPEARRLRLDRPGLAARPGVWPGIGSTINM